MLCSAQRCLEANYDYLLTAKGTERKALPTSGGEMPGSWRWHYHLPKSSYLFVTKVLLAELQAMECF